MKIQLKKLADQVVVITGASSGIGLTTARRAAKRGAKLVLVSRNEDALKQLTEELARQGCEAIFAVADVGDEEQVKKAAQAAVDRFGGFDTWVNNAAVSIFGRNEEVLMEDNRRLFQTNFWGQVYGSLVAVAHLKQRGGGALINLGSEVSDLAAPLQGMYSASKHAVKGFTDSLRLELEEEGAPISVTLIKPAAIDTMFVPHSKNYLEVEPKLPPPVYAPELVADAILYAAEHPKRDIYVGGASKMLSSTQHHAPAMMDKFMSRFGFRMSKTDKPAGSREDNNLYAPGVALRERQGAQKPVLESSLYTKAATNPKTTRALLLGTGLALAALWQYRRNGSIRSIF